MKKQRPCKSWVWKEGKEDGEKWYCENGPEGHYGGCIGGKPESVYKQQVRTGWYPTWDGMKIGD